MLSVFYGFIILIHGLSEMIYENEHANSISIGISCISKKKYTSKMCGSLES
jgi:hypothetical protein